VSLALLAVLPLDPIVWRVNVPLMMRDSGSRIAVQLSVQPISPEGLPVLLPLLKHPDAVVARGAAAVIGTWHFSTPGDYGEQPPRWTEYQASRDWARRRIAPHEADILQLIPNKDWEYHQKVLERHTGHWI